MSTEGLEHAQSITRALLANVQADQLDQPTPCQSWALRDVINHLVAANIWFAGTMSSGASAPEDKTDYASGEFLHAYDAACAASVAAFGAPGALDKIVKLPFGELPGSTYLGLATNDIFAHGWDVAKATGQPTDLDPATAEQLLAGMGIGGIARPSECFRTPRVGCKHSYGLLGVRVRGVRRSAPSRAA